MEPRARSTPWPLGSSELARLVREHDWAATPLGPIEAWPERLRAVVDLVLGSGFPMVALWGPDLVQIYNDGYSRIMDGKHPAGLGQPTHECWPEVWAINGPIYERVRAGETVALEDALFPVRREEGLKDAWFTLSYSPLRDETGAVAGVLVTVVETTRRLRAEARQAESSHRLKAVLEQGPLAIAVTGGSGEIVFRNAEFDRLWGRPAHDTTAKTYSMDYEGYHLDGRSIASEEWPGARVIDRGEVINGEVLEIVQQGGRRIACSFNAGPIRDEEGRITGGVVMFRDVTGERRMQAALSRRNEDLYRAIVETATDYAIFTTDPEGRIEAWPPGAQQVFGWTAEEAAGQPVEITYTAEDREAGVPATERQEAQETGQALNVRWHVCKNGSRVFIDGVMRPLRGPDGDVTGFLKVGQDVTRQRATQERLKVLVSELQHRTRNLMAVVQALARKTLAGATSLEDFEDHFHDRMGALARVNGLLSRLQEGDRTTFDELITTELAAQGAVNRDGSGPQVTLAGPRGVRLKSSTVQTLALVLHELATNAAKYGALAQREARLAVRWERLNGASEPLLLVEWIETGVAMPDPSAAPQGGGYGRELIERALPYQLGAETTYEMRRDGVRCTITLPLSGTTERTTSGAGAGDA